MAFLSQARRDRARFNSRGARKRHFCAIYMLKCILLPRQARDKHRETSKKRPISCRPQPPSATHAQRQQGERQHGCACRRLVSSATWRGLSSPISKLEGRTPRFCPRCEAKQNTTCSCFLMSMLWHADENPDLNEKTPGRFLGQFQDRLGTSKTNASQETLKQQKTAGVFSRENRPGTAFPTARVCGCLRSQSCCGG